MTLAAQDPVDSYIGAGSTNTYAFTFPVFSQTDLVVYVTGPSPTFTEYSLILGTDYTVSGLSPAGDPASTGSIVLVNSSQAWLTAGNLTTGYTLIIQRLVSIEQDSSIRNQGDFFQEYIENALDYLTMIDQQLDYQLGQQVSLPVSILPSDFDPVLPDSLAAYPGYAIVINPTGDGFALAAAATGITIPVPVNQGGTNSTTSLINGRVMQSSAGKIVESSVTITSLTKTAPTIQRFTSGSGTYTTPAGVLYLRIRLVGGGGGGGGSGTTAGTAGTDGGSTSFGSLSATGGAHGINGNTGGQGGVGGTGSGGNVANISGGNGGGNSNNTAGVANYIIGSMGGAASYFGGAGANGAAGGVGFGGKTNTGGGGGGAGANNVASIATGSGGGAGGYVEHIQTSPASTYSYSVGAGGTGQLAGTSGQVGGDGATGQIIVEEYYQ